MLLFPETVLITGNRGLRLSSALGNKGLVSNSKNGTQFAKPVFNLTSKFSGLSEVEHRPFPVSENEL